MAFVFIMVSFTFVTSLRRIYCFKVSVSVSMRFNPIVRRTITVSRPELTFTHAFPSPLPPPTGLPVLIFLYFSFPPLPAATRNPPSNIQPLSHACARARSIALQAPHRLTLPSFFSAHPSRPSPPHNLFFFRTFSK